MAALALVLTAGCAHFQSQPLSAIDSAASLEARTLDDPAFRAFLETNLQRRFESWPLKSWDLETLTLAAFYYHPSLDVARTEWRLAQGGEITAGERPNPTLNITPGYDFNYTGLSPWLPSIELDIPVETAGKRGIRQAQARQLSESARLNIAVAAWAVRNNLRASLIDLAAARERENILTGQQSLQEKIVHSLEQQVQAGAIANFDLSQARIALGKVQLDLADARQQDADARVRVADAVGLPAKALAEVDLVYDLSSRPAEAAELTTAGARDEALQHRADILGALADYAAAQSALQLEIAKQYPDIHLGPGYQYDHGEHTITLSITAELPILNQNQGPIAEAAARRAEAAAQFNALQAKVLTEIDRAEAGYRVSSESLSSLEELEAAQKKQSDSVAAELRAGAADQLDVLDAQLELATSELSRLDGQLKFQQSFAALENAVQRPIPAVQPSLLEKPPRPAATQAMNHNQP